MATILIAEDSETMRAVLRAQLLADGYDVVEAADGEAALARANEREFDVMVLDIEMPKLDGLGVLRLLRTNPAFDQIPVIFLTGLKSGEDAATGIASGAHDYLRKPIERQELSARVAAAVQTKQLQEELARKNEDLHRAATTDVLTGLHNRRHAAAELDRLISRSARHGVRLAVALLDVDHFKRVNDTRGHETGDRVLIEIGRRMMTRLRREDVLARWGGEEYLAILPDTDAAGGTAVAMALRAVVGAQHIDGLAMTVSAGVAAFAEGDTPEGLLARADAAMYQAKKEGRDRLVVAAAPA